MSKSFIYKLLIFICWFIAIVLFINSPNDINKNFMSFTLFNTIICTVFFFMHQKHYYKKIIFTSISSLFVLSMLITHFQIGIVHVLGFEIDNEWFEVFVWGDTHKGNLALTISSVGLISFYLGHVFGKRKNTTNRLYIDYIKKYGVLVKRLTILSIVFYILFFVTSGSYKFGNYYAGDQLSISNYFLNLFRIFVKSALIIKMYFLHFKIKEIRNLKGYIKFIGIPLSSIVLWHILFSIFVGDRAPIITFGVLYFGLYIIRMMDNKINLIFVLMMLTIPVLFSVLGASRSRTSNDSFLSKVSSSDYESRYSNNFSQIGMPGLSTLELALSVRCLNHAVSNVPDKYNYSYGKYQLKQVLASVPFLVGFMESYVFSDKKEEGSSADFITYLIQGKDSKYGDATTPVADLYLDFGVLGVLIGFYIFGIFAKRADFVLITGGQTSLFNWIFIMFFWSGAIYLGRATFLYYLQTIIQIYFFIFFLNTFVKKKQG